MLPWGVIMHVRHMGTGEVKRYCYASSLRLIYLTLVDTFDESFPVSGKLPFRTAPVVCELWRTKMPALHPQKFIHVISARDVVERFASHQNVVFDAPARIKGMDFSLYGGGPKLVDMQSWFQHSTTSLHKTRSAVDF